MVYLVLIYALIYTLGEFVSRRIGLPHSVTFAGLAVFLAAALILYRRRYGLGACRPGAEAVAGAAVAAALAGRRSGAGRLRPQRRRGRVFRLRDVRRVRHGGGAGFPRVSVGTYAAAAAADGRPCSTRPCSACSTPSISSEAHRAPSAYRRCAPPARLRPVRDGRLLPLHRAGAGHPCAHQSLRRTFPRR